ncbi:MAG: hypothetical protein WC781_02425 [Candidatus Pacearchaeota archaeon]|jgi:hypothetical protein
MKLKFNIWDKVVFNEFHSIGNYQHSENIPENAIKVADTLCWHDSHCGIIEELEIIPEYLQNQDGQWGMRDRDDSDYNKYCCRIKLDDGREISIPQLSEQIRFASMIERIKFYLSNFNSSSLARA